MVPVATEVVDLLKSIDERLAATLDSLESKINELEVAVEARVKLGVPASLSGDLNGVPTTGEVTLLQI